MPPVTAALFSLPTPLQSGESILRKEKQQKNSLLSNQCSETSALLIAHYIHHCCILFRRTEIKPSTQGN